MIGKSTRAAQHAVLHALMATPIDVCDGGLLGPGVAKVKIMAKEL